MHEGDKVNAGKVVRTPSAAKKTLPATTIAAVVDPADAGRVPKVVSVRKAALRAAGHEDFLDWLATPGHVYIGRNMAFYVRGADASKWRNPYTLKKYTLEDSLARYEELIRGGPLWDQLGELREVAELGCWCAPGPCHGNVLQKLLRERFGEGDA
jgi:hypothetical protein